MIDFLTVSTRPGKRGNVEVYPSFTIKKSQDLMIRGGDFYAIWVEDRGLWSTDEDDVIQLIDRELERYATEIRDTVDGHVRVMRLRDAETGMIDTWHRYCQKQMRDSFSMLDEKIVFSNAPTNKKDYASKRLSYPLEKAECPAYDKLMSTLYSEEERRKLEWAIGAIVTGDSKWIQKFMVLYGGPGTGKSTILNIIQDLFDGYYSVFDARALGSSSNSFALEAFKNNPLVAIQHDGDLSKIEDNTKLNSLVSHEEMTINEKFKSAYTNRFKCFLFMGTNKPVKITDTKSGLMRRLIDVTPTGNKLPMKEYKTLTKKISFELGAIAYHCREVYLSDPGRYDDYMPLSMMGASNDFYNFMLDSYHVFLKEDGTTLKAAWEMYKTYCDEAKVPYPLSQRHFKEELKNYFYDFTDRVSTDDGERVRSVFTGFKTKMFGIKEVKKEDEEHKPKLIEFKEQESIFDKECAECPAQYANAQETPKKKWEDVKTKLSQINTSKVHYVKVPENHIVIDFDIPGPDGGKDLQRNIEEASKWPATYAELSKSGKGVHLHYIYTGDPSKLCRIYEEHIEIKVFTGLSSLRRKLTKCNDIPIASISSGLPLKGEDKLVNFDGIKSEKALRTMIVRNINKEVHADTRSSIDFIKKILDDAYASDLKYDVSDMFDAVLLFATNSTNQSDYCIKLVDKMHFKSEEPSINTYHDDDDSPLIFYDVEVFPNLFLVSWKAEGEGNPVVRMINPSPTEIEELMKFKLIGFNCRRYDNHILYGRLIGYDNEQLFNLSQNIVNGERSAFFGEAYNVSYTDVYDFSKKKQSLKKWEIELGIHHQELGLPWDQPVPEELWTKVAEYCDADVLATEAVFHHLKGDWTARQILADLAGASVNVTTNTLTAKIIFGNNRKPQSEFNYRDMGDVTQIAGRHTMTDDMIMFDHFGDEYTVFDDQGRPIFPGYKYENGKSTYRGIEVGEGGYVYAEPGMYGNVALLDIASMHPSTIIAEQLFGPVYTKRYQDLRDARVAIKHKDFDSARKMLNGALAKYLDDEQAVADLDQAIKLPLNQVYGVTAASFDNPFRDIRNKDNIVAKRGALFMVNLCNEVQKRGYTVAHIKTDSIKIPDATPEIIEFVTDYGKQYGYTFEHEATYDRMCLVNDAVYIAKYATIEKCYELYGKDYVDRDADTCKKNKKKPGGWDATGKQFAVPYVFKTLFSGEKIEFDDMCETMSVSTALYLDMNENLPDVSDYETEQAVRIKLANWDDNLDGPKKFKPKHVLPDISNEEIEIEIAKGHSYQFIGKVGCFCPIKSGSNGGLLVRQTKAENGKVKYTSANGAKGYRWLEAEMVKELNKQDVIDKSYYYELCDAAIDVISAYGDFAWFVSDEPYVSPNPSNDTPPWEEEENTAFDVR